DGSGVFGGLALRVGEVGGNRDDGLLDLLAEIGFRVRLQLLQDHGRDLLRRQLPVVYLDLMIRPHLALDAGDGAVGQGERLPLGKLAHQPFAVAGEADDRGTETAAIGQGNDGRLATLHHRHDRVRRPQVDSYDLRHDVRSCYSSSSSFSPASSSSSSSRSSISSGASSGNAPISRKTSSASSEASSSSSDSGSALRRAANCAAALSGSGSSTSTGPAPMMSSRLGSCGSRAA